ncbi:MAG: iron-containing redox enzyme family protein [Ramlibacter sp.]|nr:iron-containing redox enzyme family protein [Ramlibacter sp.]
MDTAAPQKSTYLARIETLLYAPDIDRKLSEPGFRDLPAEISELTRRAFEEESAADQQHVHEVLYAINVASLALPWECDAVWPNHPLIAGIRRTIESAWERSERVRHERVLQSAPPAAKFEQWITEHIRDHRSNVSHPLFRFLKEEATLDQLRLFFFQETPFDIFHADLITMMMPGIYGVVKQEMAHNFWDEMGGGRAEAMHRTIRIDTARSLGLDTEAHVREIHRFCCEELALANMYFDTIANRGKLLQGIGAMLATETMVPGRINHQIAGFRRNGLDDGQIYYLTLHAEVDIEHGRGWMRNVVLPVLGQHPAALREVLLGVERRLHCAGAVCDRMLRFLPAAAPAQARALAGVS